MKAQFSSFVVPLVCSIAAAACAQASPPPETATGVTNAHPVDSASAAVRLASAECQHAASCGSVGDGQPYTSMDACLGKAQSDAQGELRQDKCPNGVDSTHLQVCESAIFAESCSGLANSFNRRLACRNEALCP